MKNILIILLIVLTSSAYSQLLILGSFQQSIIRLKNHEDVTNIDNDLVTTESGKVINTLTWTFAKSIGITAHFHVLDEFEYCIFQLYAIRSDETFTAFWASVTKSSVKVNSYTRYYYVKGVRVDVSWDFDNNNNCYYITYEVPL